MIVDSSALLAIALNESDEDRFLEVLGRSKLRRMSAATWLESYIRIDSLKSNAVQARFEELMEVLAIQVVPVDLELARAARLAHARFGRGNHPARLNFGDCFSYALAKNEGQPLLFKGNDFSRTDIIPALT